MSCLWLGTGRFCACVDVELSVGRNRTDCKTAWDLYKDWHWEQFCFSQHRESFVGPSGSC